MPETNRDRLLHLIQQARVRIAHAESLIIEDRTRQEVYNAVEQAQHQLGLLAAETHTSTGLVKI